MRLLGAAFGLALILGAALPNAADAASVVWAYPVGNEPFGVTIDPSDGRIYVANSDGGTNNPGFLSVVDPALSCSPSSCPLTQIALASSPTMSADDLSFVGEVLLPEVPRLALAVDTARQLVYVGGYSTAGRLYVVDATLRRLTRALDLQTGGSFPLSATLVAAEDRLYLSQSVEYGPNSIVVLDLGTQQVVQRVLLPWQPGQIALHANGRLYVAEP